MKVLMIGRYDIENHPRCRVIRDGLKINGVDVEVFSNKNLMLLVKRIIKKNYDVLFVTGKPPLFLSVLLKIFHKKKIIFDVFISDYDSLVLDRKTIKPNSIKAKLLWLMDKYSCKLSDYVIHDTEEHKKYFYEEFKSDLSSAGVIPLGADEKIFYPRKKSLYENFTVCFHGTFIPLQGLQYIIKAAKILSDKKIETQFIIIGEGQTFLETKMLALSLNLKNVKFLGMKKPDDVAKYLSKSHIGLGIFGDTNKTQRVIPNKAYEVIAMKKPLLSGNTPAMRKYFTHRETIEFCNVADEKDLALAITNIKWAYEHKLIKIDEKGYELYQKEFSNKVIGKKMKKIIKEVLR